MQPEPDEAYLRDLRVLAWPTLTESESVESVEAEPEVVIEDPRIGQVRAFYGSRPLGAYAEAMVRASDAYGIDWRLLPVISILESSGGVHACGGNAWGYAACKVRFGTFDEGIQTVAATLARAPYAGRSTAVVLCIWVSGSACTNDHGVNYVYKAFSLYTSLGGWFALPPRPVTQSVVVVEQATPTPVPSPTTTQPSTDPATATPSPSDPEPTPEPTATPQPTAAPEPTGTVAAVEGQEPE